MSVADADVVTRSVATLNRLSVYCGDCGSRLVITNAKNRHGVVYPYFVCLGQHQKTTDCTRKALLISKIDKMVEDHWTKVRLATDLRDAIEEGLRSELATHRKEPENEHRHLVAEKAKLTAQRQKLFEAIYSGAAPMDLIAIEQQRITDQLTAIETSLTRALDLARDCHAAYLAADPLLRRFFNQAFFTHLMIDEEGVHSEYAEPSDTLLDDDVLDAGQAAQADRVQSQAKLAEILESPAAPVNKKTPSTRGAGGLSLNLRTPFWVSKVRI